MTIALTALYVKHERRVRLGFSENLAGGAFSTTLYTCVNTDGGGVDPGVESVLLVANSPNFVELQLGNDLVEGARYLVTAVGVPGIDATVTPAGTQDAFLFGSAVVPFNVEAPTSDLDALLYGTDLVHDGTDFVETPDGDLATVGGLANASGAIYRRLTGNPLPWDPDYSPNLRTYVDGAAAAAGQARGAIARNAQLDDRVSDVAVAQS